MAARRAAKRDAVPPPESLGKFSEGTLGKLVDDALARIESLRADIREEGEVVEDESRGGPIVNPKMKVLQDEREWVRKAWSTKFTSGKADGKESNYFRAGPSAD